MRFATRVPIVLVFWALTGFADGLAPWVGPNVRPGPDPEELPAGDGKNQAEPHIVRSWNNPDLILATFQEGRFSDGGAVSNGYAVSEDGGFTWRRALNERLTKVSGGTYFRATDPVGAISSDGILYLNSLASVDAAFGQADLVVQRSTDFGASWSFPIVIYSGESEGVSYNIFPDKNWMTINDYPGAATEGRLVVTWTNFRTIRDETTDINDYLIMASHSDNNGNTWSFPAFVTPPGSSNFSREQYQGSQPAFLPGGGMVVLYHNFLTSRIELAYSPDGGANFQFTGIPVHSGYILFDAVNLRDGTFLPSVSVARETGDVYVVYTSQVSASNPSGYIYFTRSQRSDQGTSPEQLPNWNFTAPLNVSGLQPTRIVTTPTLSVSPDGERVTVHFFDNRNDTLGGYSGDFYAVQSTDGGYTWTAPFRLSSETFDFRKATNTNRGYMLGDYFGMAAPLEPDDAAVAIWVDTRLETADPWTARIGGLSGSVFDSWLQANLPYALRESSADFLELDDSDKDGVPNIIEYVLDRSPRIAEPVPEIENGLSHFLLAEGTDPDLQVTVRGGTGRWPAAQSVSGQVPFVQASGEGYWNTLSWSFAGELDHLEFIINDDRWFLLDATAPVRWVESLENDWIWSPWMGYLYNGQLPWLFHPSIGWLYDLSGLFYSVALDDYLFPDIHTFPWMATGSGNWIYIPEAEGWLYESETGEWVRTR